MDLRLLNFFDESQSRKSAVIRQTFANKKTASNLYWALRYQILDYLNIYPKLNSIKFDYEIDQLVKKDLLVKKENEYLLSKKGKIELKKYNETHLKIEHPENFQRVNYVLWNAILLLLIQTTSEYTYHNNYYYVATDNLQAQYLVKKWLQHFGFDNLVVELSTCLKEFLSLQEQIKADIFANKLIGHQQNGLTDEQIASLLNRESVEIEATFKDLELQFAIFLLNKENHLSLMAKQVQLSGLITETVAQTIRLFKKGLTLPQIESIRHLKFSTITEHLQIWALADSNFPFDQVLSRNEIELLDNIYENNEIDNWKFKQVQAQDADFSFYKFRLYSIMRTYDESNTK